MRYSMKNYQNPFKTFKKHELAIWLGSLVLVTVSFMFPRERDYLTLIASLIGVTSLILNAKGDPSYLPMIVCFSVFFVNDCYGFINWRKIRQRQGEN